MFTIQKGTRVTSTNREGSQKPTGTPGTGIPILGQIQGIVEGFEVSSRPHLAMFTGPIVMGKRHDQQMSVMGLTKRPEQVLL